MVNSNGIYLIAKVNSQVHMKDKVFSYFIKIYIATET